MKLNLFFSARVRPLASVAGVGLLIFSIRADAFPAPSWMQGGHAARISGLACSPDGSKIASSSEDGTIKVWSTNGTLLRTLNTQPYPATAVAWSPDGVKIAAGTYNGGYSSRPGLGLTYVWQAASGWTSSVALLCVSTNFYGKVTALAFSADSTRLASGNAGGSNLVTAVSSGSILASLPAYNTAVGPAAVTSVAFSSRGMLASACEDKTLRVFNSSWSQLWSSSTSHASNVTALAFSPDGSVMASASLDCTIRVWSTTNWSSLQTLIGHTNGVLSLAFSPNGQKIVSGSADGTVKIWNWSSGACQLTIAAHALPVGAIAFSADGTRVISGSDDKTVRLWSASDGSPLLALGGQREFIGAIAFSPDGSLCASAGGDATIAVRNTADGSLVNTLPGHTNYTSSLAFSPDSQTVASGGGPLDPTVKLWRISDGTLLQTIPATTNGVMALAWSPDGLTLAVGGDSLEPNITFWSSTGILQGTLPGTVSGHTNGVTALAFSAQGNLLASGGRRPGNSVRVWTNSIGGIWTTGVVVQSFISTSTSNNVECVTFSPNGKLIAWCRNGQNVLKVGQISDGTNPTLGSSTNPVLSVAFSPDGTTLAATMDQSTITLWTNSGPTSWALCETVTNEASRASRLSYSPNGNLLFCGREDGTLVMSPNTRGALGQPRLTFTSLKADPTGSATLGASVQPLTHYVLQTSTNLRDWSFQASVSSSSNRLVVTGLPTTNSPTMFHRALTPP